MATNERFQHLLEGAVSAAYDKKLKDAKRVPRKRIIERLRLYGVGFGGRLPTISKKKRSDSEADVVALVKEGCTLGRCASTYCTQPPDGPASASGELRYEHEALYKAFVHGHRSKADPERMFFSASHANADCAGGNRPPWYYGFQDPGHSIDGARYLQTAKRYGYRGSSAMRDHHPPRSADSFRTVQHGTPLFLRQHSTVVDEWTPMILAGPPGLGMPLFSSPKLWPANTMYVEGFKNKAKSKSALYNKETTINTNLKGPDAKVLKMVNMEEEERTALEGAMDVERRNLWCYSTDDKGLRTADPAAKVEDEMVFSPHLLSARSRRSPQGGRNLYAATTRHEGDLEEPSLDEGSAESSRVLESGNSGSQAASNESLLSPTAREAGNKGSPGAWARGNQYWPSKKQQAQTPARKRQKKRKGRKRREGEPTAAAEYQDRRKGAKMQLARDETILIRNRVSKQQTQETPMQGTDAAGGGHHDKLDGGGENRRRRDNLSFVQYHLKWHAVRHLYDIILNSRLPGRPSTSLNLVSSLCAHLQAHATANEAKTMIGRDSFINALLGKYGSLILDSKANLIFSTFDPVNLNRIHYVHLIACLSILERPNEPAKKKLLNLWKLYKEHRKDRNVLDNIISILTTCCSTAAEHATMERAVRSQFIPYCYRTIALKPSAAVKTQLDTFKHAGPIIKAGNAKKAQVQAARAAEEEAAKKKSAAAEQAASGQSRGTAGRGTMPDSKETDVVYNICNEALDENDFGEALAACPQVLEIFDEHMKTICYQQNRRTMEESERDRVKRSENCPEGSPKAGAEAEGVGRGQQQDQ